MTTFGIPVEPDVSINLATVSPVILARESSTADVGPATESSLNDTLVSEVGGPSTQTKGTSFRSSASILMTENSASSACHREPARPETHLQATAGSQRDFSLVKVLLCAQSQSRKAVIRRMAVESLGTRGPI